jgi:ABC-type polysaccharide/polyol phosphate transport system ATPase subunit
MRSDVAISVKNLTKTYRIFGHPGDRIKQALTFGRVRFHREFTALQDVSFEIKKGETVGIIGRNGSGKSTLLQLICGILKPTSGSVQVNGRVSALLELGAGFNPEFTGRENVYFQGAVMGFTKTEMDDRFDEISAFADIGEFIDQPVRTYSSGMFVRLAFSTMIHADADVLVIDEALAVGDEAFQRKCFDKLSEYLNSQEKVLFLVSHNTRQIERVCSRVIWLHDGRVVEQGNSRELCNAYQASTHEHIQHSYSDGKPQPDTADSGELTVDRVCLCAPDIETPIKSVTTHSSARIIVEFNCHVPLNSPDIIVGFHTLDSVFIAAANTGRLAMVPDFAPGRHRAECLFPEITLLPGVYQIRLVFLDCHRRMMWGGHGLCTFQILPTSESNVMRIPLGLVDMPFEWRIPSGNV